MGLFSILKGDTLYFNKNAVPVWNDINARVNAAFEKSSDSVFITRDKKVILANALEMAQICVLDMLFHPNTGVIRNRVKSFNKEAFYVLYEIIILFLISTFKNIKPQEADELKRVCVDAIGRREECDALWSEIDKFYKNSSEEIKIILNKISTYTGPLDKKEEPNLISVFRGLVITFIDGI